jgi:hypothetical protein
MEIIGMSGFARSGKDEAAKVLVNEFGFTRVAFADKLRDFLYAVNPIVSAWNEMIPPCGDPLGNDEPFIRYTHLKEVIENHGWDGYKETHYGKEIRRLLQRLGTEAGRQVLGQNVWVDATLDGLLPDGKYIVTDARFFNEFDAIRDRGGEIWRVERTGVGPVSDHPSETEAIDYPHFACTLHNNGTLEEYYDSVRVRYQARKASQA